MNQNVGITDLSTGINAQGMEEYIESLRLHLLQEVSEDIDAVDDVVTVINAGWQGVARDRFLKNFAEQREEIKNDLIMEFLNTEGRLRELQANYFKQDENMIIE